ncbi:hypothetical protein SDC9_150786 [bioreactor metagenome]|uniref:Uncharacterized protein n=1 Tax=bioreactor metagenome TaxID=1076179 RepID=A0A645ENG2_9ZZZZ
MLLVAAQPEHAAYTGCQQLAGILVSLLLRLLHQVKAAFDPRAGAAALMAAHAAAARVVDGGHLQGNHRETPLPSLDQGQRQAGLPAVAPRRADHHHSVQGQQLFLHMLLRYQALQRASLRCIV